MGVLVAGFAIIFTGELHFTACGEEMARLVTSMPTDGREGLGTGGFTRGEGIQA